MPRFTLRTFAPQEVSGEEASSSFYWLPGPQSSFTTTLGSILGALGPVTERNIDVVHIALTAFAADRSVLREGHGSNWNQRVLDLEVPVSDPEVWSTLSEELASVLGFLSGDRWTLTFTARQALLYDTDVIADRAAPQRVVLLSGGADSAIGGLYSRSLLSSGEQHILLSHYSHTMLAPIQRHVANEIARLLPGPGQQHMVAHLGRRSHRIDGTIYPTEPTSRSRSLLFLALGLAAASVHGVPLWIPENGFASLNPPLGPERLGSLSTRTTHPTFLRDLSTVFAKAGAHSDIVNPFAKVTKGEMYRQAIDLIGDHEASSFLSSTHSCALTGQRTHHISAERPCGVCFGCVLRRASFAAAGVIDTSMYIAPSEDTAVQRWLDGKSVEQAVRNLIRRGVRPRDLLALSLPPDYPMRDAMDLCRRGVAELAQLYS